jgi:hypothetical protein
MSQNYDTPVSNKILKLEDEDVKKYLESLWGCEKENPRILNDFPENNNIDKKIIDNFEKNVENKFDNIKIIGNFSYTNQLEQEVRLKKNELGDEEIKLSYICMRDLITNSCINNNTMNKINKVHIGLKIKDENKNKNDITNYRFLQVHSKTIKLIDRIWCLRIVDSIKNLDCNIFKCSLIKQINNSLIETANKNTLSIENVVLIDLEKAFDSCDYDVVEDLMFRSLKRKINEKFAKSLTDQYMYILRQREVYYHNLKIDFRKGLPTGLPSSNIIFSLLMDELINEWLEENKSAFKVDKDFIINIYVDDIYLKILNNELKNIIIVTLIDKIKKYKFNVNFEKCKADKKLELEFFTNLEEYDFYLGIPFTRDFRKYTTLILKKFNDSNHTNLTYKQIFEILIKKEPLSKQIIGFFNYKFTPIMKEDENIIDFIEKIDLYTN